MNQTYLSLILRIIISGAFLLSAISKIISPGYFEITLIDQGLLASRETAAYATRVFVILELSLGILLLQNNFFKRIVIPAVMILLSLFSVYLIFLLFQGDDRNCGCFSSVIRMNPLEALLKNILLLVFAIYLYANNVPRINNKLVPTIIILFSTVFVLISSPVKSVDEFPFSKYTQFTNIGRVDLAEGENLIAVFDATCDHCMETAKGFKRIMSEVKTFPEIYILMFSENDDDISKFNLLTKTNFPLVKIDVDEFFDLIGDSPPRVYYLMSGEVSAVWDKNIEENLWETFSSEENSILQFNFEE